MGNRTSKQEQHQIEPEKKLTDDLSAMEIASVHFVDSDTERIRSEGDSEGSDGYDL